MQPVIQKACCITLVIVPLLCTGWVQRQVRGDTVIFSNEPWIVAVTALMATMVTVVGLFLRRKKRWVGYLCISGGILILFTTVPSLALSRTTVGQDHFEWRRGLKHTSIRFDELAEIVHTVKRVPIGRSIQDVHYFDFRKKTGTVVHVQVEPGTDRYFLDATPEILLRARMKGVRVTEPQRE